MLLSDPPLREPHPWEDILPTTECALMHSMLLDISGLETQYFIPKDTGIGLLPVLASPPFLLQMVFDHLVYPNDKKNRIQWL